MDYRRMRRAGDQQERRVQELWLVAANTGLHRQLFDAASKPSRYRGKPQVYRVVRACNK
jgi:hypothetical protein